MTDSHPLMACPLCRGRDIHLVEQIDGSAVSSAWIKSYGIRFESPLEDLAYLHCRGCELRFFNPAQSGGPQLYEQLQQHDWYYVDDKPEYAVAARWLPAHGEVLEVGSGKAAFARFVTPARYRGLEFNSVAIERARLAGVSLFKESIQDHSRSNAGRYSAVVSFQVLEHVEDPAGFLQACVAALQPGVGRLILAVPDHDGLCGLAQNNILDMPPHHVSHWNERSLRAVGRLFGLELLSIERESVSELHQSWARRAVIERRLRGIAGLDQRLLDTRWRARLIGRLAARRASGPVEIGDVTGHTIVAAYRLT
ncbi:MAG: class I SAM-dependent methyltransferase [Rubrivivax sp.]|nr:class I SAM-dependent methyltransferase [Rubrivivax sp.]